MNDLKTITGLVKHILVKDKQARNSDSYLYLKVLQRIAAKSGIDLDNITVPDFLLYGKAYGFPPFESVRRTRQKVQEHYPELKGCDKVQDVRFENEAKYRAFAKDVI